MGSNHPSARRRAEPDAGPAGGAARVLLIDNLDSFTFNVADLLHRVLGTAPTVWRHDHPATQADLLEFDAIVVGPGPGRPQHVADLGISSLALAQREVPVLGICLGHQGMALLAGDEVVQMSAPMHGRVSSVYHDGTGILAGIPSPFRVVRYHSLEVVDDSSVLRPAGWAADDGCVMVLADPDRRRFGVQFHPESVLSEHGERLTANFMRLAGVPLPEQRRSSTPPGADGGDTGPVALGDAPVAHLPGATHLTGRTPVTIRAVSLGGATDAAALAEQLLDTEMPAVWLDSSSGTRGGAGEPSASTEQPPGNASQSRFSVVAVADGPLAAVLTHRVGQGTLVRHTPGGVNGETEHTSRPLLPTVQDWLDRFAVEDRSAEADFPASFRPGFVGYLGYELRAETAPDAGDVPGPDRDLPDANLLFVDRAVVFDHQEQCAYAIWLEDDQSVGAHGEWVERMRAAVTAIAPTQMSGEPPLPVDSGADIDRVESGMRANREEYLAAVHQCQELIRAGESYEMCLTTAVQWPMVGLDERALYRAIREASPVPFGVWLRTPEVSVLGASPERFCSVGATGGVQARPIKGTRGRDPDPGADAALAAELAASVKDRAENLMIVDLLRNDLHRVCRSGSVRVPELFAVETYATVHQLVSTVTGELADGMSAVDLLASAFPGGSMTGAPKVRTMRLLHEIEQHPRGVYSGAIGWLGVNGAMDTSIVIRTVTLVEGQARFGIGGAVTALSDPEEEYAEILHKARGLARALTVAGG